VTWYKFLLFIPQRKYGVVTALCQQKKIYFKNKKIATNNVLQPICSTASKLGV
jgi:hypothetical protein